jgi:Cu2+-exporting ATPase
MKHAKYLLMAFFALCLTASLNAQTTKKKSKSKTTKNAMHYQCPMKCEGDKTYHKNGKCPVCGMQMKPVKAAVANANFKCPMKCEGDKMYAMAGKCPVCNMKLKEVSSKKEDDHKDHSHH